MLCYKKEKYLDIEVVFKDDRFNIVAKHGGWANMKIVPKNLEKQFAVEQEAKEKEKIRQEHIEQEEKGKALKEQSEKKEIVLEVGQDLRFRKYQRVVRYVEKLTFKTPTKINASKQKDFEKV